VHMKLSETCVGWSGSCHGFVPISPLYFACAQRASLVLSQS
jgi:hypothetical protein